jgi:large subunit ribosomal protein L25
MCIRDSFQAVSQTEKIRAKVGVVITGTAPAVKDFNGVVVEGLDAIEVEALPKDLPERFVIDISKLAAIGDAIHVKDVEVPANVEIVDDVEAMLVLITAPAAEEAEPVAGEGEAIEPEVIEKGKKDEEEEEK